MARFRISSRLLFRRLHSGFRSLLLPFRSSCSHGRRYSISLPIYFLLRSHRFQAIFRLWWLYSPSWTDPPFSSGSVLSLFRLEGGAFFLFSTGGFMVLFQDRRMSGSVRWYGCWVKTRYRRGRRFSIEGDGRVRRFFCR